MIQVTFEKGLCCITNLAEPYRHNLAPYRAYNKSDTRAELIDPMKGQPDATRL